MVTTYSVHEGAFVTEETREWSPPAARRHGVLSNFSLAPNGTRIVTLLPAAEPADEESPSHVTFALTFAHEVHGLVQSRGR